MPEKKAEDSVEQQEHGHIHTHVLADGTTISHTHGAHGHQHSHTQTKAVLNRMSRLIGHLEAIKRMVEEGRDCSEVLVQLSAVRSAINGVSKIILKDHLEHCVVDAVKENDKEAIAQLNKAIDQFMK
ncbi:DNA-binding transcriptional regulator, FrmR family [Selenomonas sp. GACV-9]|uniref:metal-sensing transcriptional repressor n=1 Tax=Selenomonas sp. GACV-9 TaxID=3158782 RepID=UPI0008F2C869|nr:DNA-binding transcriptional regulator, FrmR family [Selenomonas ruminantium]